MSRRKAKESENKTTVDHRFLDLMAPAPMLGRVKLWH